MVGEQQGGFFDQPRPAPLQRRGVIHIGTSGYSFPDWQGAFYPRKLPKNQWLAHYAGEFSAVEINATYYRLPPAATFAAMAAKTPPGYPFWVKLPGEVTHGGGDVKAVMTAFFEAVRALRESERLAGGLAQFPPSFRPSAKSLDKLRQLRYLCGDVPLAVEFRWRDWQTPETFGFLREQGIIVVVPDLPPLPGLPETELEVTAPVAYVRFHGRNSKTWLDSRQGDRYDYDYSATELQGWLPKIAALEEAAPVTFLFFNNCHLGQAVKNARMLREMLKSDFGTLL